MQAQSKDRLQKLLKDHQQEHLLRFWGELNADQRIALARQIDAIDLDQIRRIQSGSAVQQDFSDLAARAKSPAAYRLQDSEAAKDAAAARAAAKEALSAGKLGVILVAGGQGTRLGFPHPKGMFRLGPLSGRSLFQMHAEQLLALAARFGVSIPLYLMTSPATHEETVQFWQDHDNFGLPHQDLRVFCQGTMPAVDNDGRLLLERRDRVSLSPDGHGGMLAAFLSSGCLSDVNARGLEHLFYFQVDNPLARICDPELIGHHLIAKSEMTTQVVAKRTADEKVGNVVDVDGRLMVIEYSDLPDSAGQRRKPDGSLELWAGSIAIHVFEVEFLARAAQSDSSLPFHLARKKVPYVNQDGETVWPDEPNATKFEKFIFDLMPTARNAIVVEAAEEEVFAPLKNASGAAKDSPETARAAIINRDRRRLRQAGITVADNVAVEINPRYALDVEELQQKLQPGRSIDQDTYLS